MKTCVACAEQIQGTAKLCRYCGTRQDDEEFVGSLKTSVKSSKKSEVTPAVKASKSENVCPVCKSSSSISKVSSIIDGGTSTSAGISVMSQFGNPLNSYTGVTVGSTSSVLAQRLSIQVPEAKFHYSYLFWGWLFCTIGLNNSFGRPGSILNGGSWPFTIVICAFVAAFIGPLVGMVVGFIEKANQKKKLLPVQVQAANAIQALRNSYYCSRDDVVFKGAKFGSPEDYVMKLLG